MSNWTSRETKLRQKHINKSFSKPFKKKLDKDPKRKERQNIREAQQRAKYNSVDDDNDQEYERE